MSDRPDWSALEVVAGGFALRWRRMPDAHTAIDFEIYDEWCLDSSGAAYADETDEVMLELTVRGPDSCVDWMTPEGQGYSHFCEPEDAYKLARTFDRAWAITAEQNAPLDR